jgi:hypothetical protein
MIRHLLFSCVLFCGAAAVGTATPAFAHHTNAAMAHTMATVNIPAGLMAGGKPLPAGRYEVIITDEHPATESGTPSENQRWVEFVQNGTVVAREIAEVFGAADRPVGTSGAAGGTRAQAVVQTLRGGEFVRVAINAGGARFLIHLPAGLAATQH